MPPKQRKTANLKKIIYSHTKLEVIGWEFTGRSVRGGGGAGRRGRGSSARLVRPPRSGSAAATPCAARSPGQQSNHKSLKLGKFKQVLKRSREPLDKRISLTNQRSCAVVQVTAWRAGWVYWGGEGNWLGRK